MIGHHPHVVQSAETYRGRQIFYSLGNFVFDQAAPDNSEALAVDLRLSLPPGAGRASLDRLVLHPVVIDESAPGPADEARAARILQRAGVAGRELAP